MKKIINLSILFLILLSTIGCSSIAGSEYILEKRYPQTIPILKIKFLNDSSAVILKKENTLISRSFNFRISKKNFLIITNSEDSDQLEYFRNGDTIVWYKKELYLSKKDYKLVFKKQQ